MPRPTVRTKQLTLDEITAIKGLFGTIKNAMRCLRLGGHVPEADVRRAMAWLPVSHEYGSLIQDRWFEWRKHFLQEEAVHGTGFVLPND
jgi:hypothetical protein